MAADDVGEPCISLDGVSLRYGTTVALDDVSLTVRPGERLALLGLSGAGKSSLLSLIGTSRAPSAGTVSLFGRAVAGLSQPELRVLRRRLAVVEQRPALPGALRVVHNVNAGRLADWSTGRALSSLLLRARDADGTRRALELVGIGDKLWSRTDQLSGGERQRVALARVLVRDAKLVLADEPVASLDPARAREVLELLCAPQHETVVVSLHDVDLALAHVDRVVGLRQGRLLFDLPTAEVTRFHVDQLYDLAPR